jgi:hypothetical protein
MIRLRPLILGCMILVLGTAAAPGAEKAADKPAAPKADKATMVAVVKAVKGTVETRAGKDQPWTPVKVGMQLPAGADIRTGFRARCVLDMTDSLVQVDPLTVVRIGELRKDGETVRTRLYMMQGNTQAVVEKGKIESDFAIVTPSATLSVRGSFINTGFFPVFGGSYGTTSGLMAVRNTMLGRTTNCAPGESTDDTAKNPVQKLAQLYLPIILDSKAYNPNELNAAGRWHTSTATPGGLGGGPPPNTGSQTGGQLKDPDDDSTPEKVAGHYREDITKPPPPGGGGPGERGRLTACLRRDLEVSPWPNLPVPNRKRFAARASGWPPSSRWPSGAPPPPSSGTPTPAAPLN